MGMTEVIQKAEQMVKNFHERDTTGHDWWHIHRVRTLAVYIAQQERANVEICHLAALLHDLPDDKLAVGEQAGWNLIERFFAEQNVPRAVCDQIRDIISSISFKGGTGTQTLRSLEAQVVQDADRLDAIGAIGIARTFTYSGAKGTALYDPAIPVRDQMSLEEYRSGKSTALNHFYEKLLKLYSKLNTDTAKQIGRHRHELMEAYVREFLVEWDFSEHRE